MDKDRIAQNLACVDGHFHSEAENNVEAALELYTDDIILEAPALNGLNRFFWKGGRSQVLSCALGHDGGCEVSIPTTIRH